MSNACAFGIELPAHGPCPACGAGSDGPCPRAFQRDLAELARLRIERDHLYHYVNGLLGLLVLVRGRSDVNDEVRDALKTSHRAVDAAAYLTQIVPPRRTS